MKVNKWFGFIVSAVLILSIFNPSGVLAENKRTLQDESIYDLLVDRFNNGDYENDEGIDPRDMNAFSGGDFAGIGSRIDYISEMGFTLISLGPIFSTAKYDGSEVLDYEKLEPHFGTDEDLANLVEIVHGKNMGVLADFPMGGVSENHVWAKNGTAATIPAGNGTVDWDNSDESVKKMLKGAIVSFATTHNLDGIRLTKIESFDEAYLNEVIAAVKDARPDIYIFSNEASSAEFDSVPSFEKMEALKQSYVQFDPDSSPLELFTDQIETDLIQFDELTGPRFTNEMIALRMFPPTRWQLAATALFTLPGVPVMPYETEIAVNGKEAPETHPISNFKTEMELHELIGDLNLLRNKSEALRNGDFELLHNENGFTVYKRSSDEETWIVALNNTTETSNLEISNEIIGEKKTLRGVLNGDRVKEGKDGVYRIVFEREVAEIYIVEEDKGFNYPYLIASILIYVFFIGFLIAVMRNGKKSRGK